MYVDPFWFGVICTIGCEIILILIGLGLAAYKVFKDKENNNG